jgi:hypothetical protein
MERHLIDQTREVLDQEAKEITKALTKANARRDDVERELDELEERMDVVKVKRSRLDRAESWFHMQDLATQWGKAKDDKIRLKVIKELATCWFVVHKKNRFGMSRAPRIIKTGPKWVKVHRLQFRLNDKFDEYRIDAAGNVYRGKGKVAQFNLIKRCTDDEAAEEFLGS